MGETGVQKGGEGSTTAEAERLHQDDEALDAEAEELLHELGRSQSEVKRMLSMQQEQASQFGGLKEQLAHEVSKPEREHLLPEDYYSCIQL